MSVLTAAGGSGVHGPAAAGGKGSEVVSSRGGSGGMGPPGKEAASRARRTEESQALRIFLRLIRPRPLDDPYPLYAQLRDLAPFLPVRFPGVPAGYLVSTYAGCSRLMRDPAFGPPTHDQLDLLKPGWRDNSFTRYMYRSRPRRGTSPRLGPRGTGTSWTSWPASSSTGWPRTDPARWT